MYATIAINAAFGFFYPGISWQAHLGGFVTGLACAGVIVAFRRQRRAPPRVGRARSASSCSSSPSPSAKYLTVPEAIRELSIFG